MPNAFKAVLFRELEQKLGPIRRLAGSQSLIETAAGVRIYLRYSKVHGRGCAFFGLRRVDLNHLDGHRAFLCFFTDQGKPPLFLPYGDFDAVIRQSPVANDGQYKVQLLSGEGTQELYLARVGHFNVDAYGGFETLLNDTSARRAGASASLGHSQVQTLIGAIGDLKGHPVYIPPNNVGLLDWALARRFNVVQTVPAQIRQLASCAADIDVMWLEHSHTAVSAVFEIEHSTPIYSGLLRCNDVHLTCPGITRYFIVSNEGRRDLFARQLRRPTFQRSGLSEVTSFLEYANVVDWHARLIAPPATPAGS